MSSYVSTPLYGGSDGDISYDIVRRDTDGDLWKFVVNGNNKSQLDVDHPIQQIAVSTGWVVDGISVTYQLADGTNATVDHGSKFSGAPVVKLNANERLVGVFGRAGQQTYYKRNMISSINFVIFDATAQITRIVGPYGNSNGANQGTPFYVSDVIAFGGYALPGAAALGLSGLVFYKDLCKL